MRQEWRKCNKAEICEALKSLAQEENPIDLTYASMNVKGNEIFTIKDLGDIVASLQTWMVKVDLSFNFRENSSTEETLAFLSTLDKTAITSLIWKSNHLNTRTDHDLLRILQAFPVRLTSIDLSSNSLSVSRLRCLLKKIPYKEMKYTLDDGTYERVPAYFDKRTFKFFLCALAVTAIALLYVSLSFYPMLALAASSITTAYLGHRLFDKWTRPGLQLVEDKVQQTTKP